MNTHGLRAGPHWIPVVLWTGVINLKCIPIFRAGGSGDAFYSCVAAFLSQVSTQVSVAHLNAALRAGGHPDMWWDGGGRENAADRWE